MTSKNQAIRELVDYARSSVAQRLGDFAQGINALSVQEGLIRKLVMDTVPRLEDSLERRPLWDTSDKLYSHWIARNFTEEMIAHPAIVALSKRSEKYTDNLGTHWRIYRADTPAGDFAAAHVLRQSAREAEEAVRTPQQQALWRAYWRAYEAHSTASMEGQISTAMQELRQAFSAVDASISKQSMDKEKSKLMSRIDPAATPVEYQALVRRWAAADGTAKSSDLSDEERAKAIAEVASVSASIALSPFQIDDQGWVVERKVDVRYMVLTIENTTSAAFVDTGREQEVVRIIGEAADNLDDWWGQGDGVRHPLCDLNSNTVGHLTITDDSQALNTDPGESGVRLAIWCELTNEAYGEDPAHEAAQHLREAAHQIAKGNTHFSIHDAKGSHVGEGMLRELPPPEKGDAIDMSSSIEP